MSWTHRPDGYKRSRSGELGRPGKEIDFCGILLGFKARFRESFSYSLEQLGDRWHNASGNDYAVIASRQVVNPPVPLSRGCIISCQYLGKRVPKVACSLGLGISTGWLMTIVTLLGRHLTQGSVSSVDDLLPR